MKNIVVLADHGKVAEDAFTDFEIKYSIKLPQSFKEFISKHDAPWIDGNQFKFFNCFHHTHAWPYKIVDGFDSRDVNFLGFNKSSYDGEDINCAQGFDAYRCNNIIIFGNSANGDYICFDYRHDPETSEPCVVLMFHDAFDRDNKMLVCPVADTFEIFMNSLYKPER